MRRSRADVGVRQTTLPGASGVAEGQEWFFTREALAGTWMVDEPQHVCSWLVAGRERAVLLDTGLGVAPVRPVAERLVPVPVSVVNTHYHFDHVGGNHEFDEIAAHPLSVPLIAEAAPPDVLQAYGDYAQRQLEALAAYEELDAEFFWLLTRETRPRPFPASFDPATWTIPGTTATQRLEDGDRVDLGGRVLTVLHLPGHSPDMIALLDEREGLLFAADVFNIGPVYCHFPDSSLEALTASAHRLAELAGELRFVVAHHYGRVLAEPALLRQYARDLDRLSAGDVALVPGRDILGDALLEARFDQYSVTLAAPDAPQRALAAPAPGA